ncbi:DMSO/TMAO reductase YedYZ, molybdopterin-dependent catalytic subunit [Plantibacter sp. VKM Ac-1784]|uniref:DMSO/TMAO reductase YedYZ, molybdopterin-dependent catalytic subunit n=1 Tax=Plantibacter elymi (nom. nud.) TaxID=199708 RepID=A0ABY1RET4_9MICO|nr:molybdopterin-dependent oxidoreductase [Plantibacter sp. VKM Ac-1784]SMQ66881.1 DMSO/TMAO reductase YedYZ, molybdopterin-dependent catalytic subunit [Plantibacter sp. VKM Ac-1784]
MPSKHQTGTTRSGRRLVWFAAALSGIVAAAVFLAIAELAALLFARGSSPLLTVGSFVIDIVPRWAKEFAIETFGGNDKIFLLVSLGVAVVIAAAIAGVLQQIRPPLGVVVLIAAGVFAGATTVTRAGATPLAVVPVILGLAAGVVILVLLSRRLPKRAANGSDDERAAFDRRGFFRVAGIAAAGAVVVGVGARLVNVTTSSITAVRDALKLPAPKSTVTIPDGAEADVDGLSPLFTPNDKFYRVDTALTVPTVDPATWTLTIDGMVGEQVQITFEELLAMGLDEYVITMTCVSNEVGGNLLGNAKWLGIPVRDVLKRAMPDSKADMVLSTSVDGFTASTPLESLTDPNLDAILAVAMNGEPLPLEHGFPVRMVVPGLYGYVSATKWLTKLTVTTFDKDEAYWTPRGYDAKAPIKLSSRIDTPRIDKQLPAGPAKIAGVAWAQTVGIAKVEVSIDNGDWQSVNLTTAINDDTWVQWWMDWEATAGTHYVAVRATDKAGNLQIEEQAPIAPNGSSGWQRTLVRVG